jgi:hypothetical protein
MGTNKNMEENKERTEKIFRAEKNEDWVRDPNYSTYKKYFCQKATLNDYGGRAERDALP